MKLNIKCASEENRYTQEVFEGKYFPKLVEKGLNVQKEIVPYTTLEIIENRVDEVEKEAISFIIDIKTLEEIELLKSVVAEDIIIRGTGELIIYDDYVE